MTEKKSSRTIRCDVAVIGGGPSGCAAACAAAREGANTVLIENTTCLGGMGTAGMVPCWCHFTDRKKVICAGLAIRILREAKKTIEYVPEDWLDWVPVDAEVLKRTYDRFVLEHGASVRFQTTLAAAEAEPGRIGSITVARKDGLHTVEAAYYIDCTGDGDLAAMAGAEFEQGEAGTGETQPASLCFVMSNVDTYGFRNHPRPSVKELRERADLSKYPLLGDLHLVTFLVGPGVVGFNAGHIREADGTSPDTLDRAMIDGRLIAEEFAAAMREYFPAFRNAHLTGSASLPGIRESRRILGDYVLSLGDYLARRGFPDEIGRNNYPIDIHTRSSEVSQVLGGRDFAMQRYPHYSPGESYGIPYRCLTPRGFRNLLAAGRCISADHEMQASVRTMPACLVTGEAAGCAAGLALRNGCGDLHALDTDQLRARLREHGAYLEGETK